MIIDAPLQLPNSGRYCLLGKTEITKTLATYLGKILPKAEFGGFVASSEEAGDALLIVSDPAAPRAADYIREQNGANVAIFPLPMEDMWSWWDHSARALDSISFDGEVQMTHDDFVALLVNMERMTKDDSGGAFFQDETVYLSTQEDLLASNSAEIFEVMQGLGDNASREAYSRVMTKPPEAHWDHYTDLVFRTMQYFEYLDYGACEVVVNGGIFEGFEIPFFTTKLPRGAAIHNIDPLGFDHLSNYSRSWKDLGLQQFFEHRFALHDTKTELSFNFQPSGQVNFRSPKESDRPNIDIFPADTLDNFATSQKLDRIDLLKLDLEGGDGPALVGGLETIRKFRPQLALSIYHFPKDFWEIPLLMMRLLDDYDFYLNTYSFERWETIFYGIPQEKKRPN